MRKSKSSRLNVLEPLLVATLAAWTTYRSARLWYQMVIGQAYIWFQIYLLFKDNIPRFGHLDQRSARILDPGNSRESSLIFLAQPSQMIFSIPSRNMRITMCNPVLVSKYENDHMIISISSRQSRARKIILNLISKNCTFSPEWDSKSNPITGPYSRQS